MGNFSYFTVLCNFGSGFITESSGKQIKTNPVYMILTILYTGKKYPLFPFSFASPILVNRIKYPIDPKWVVHRPYVMTIC